MNIAIILAGGTGTRMGMSLPKQYIEVMGKPVIAYCLERFVRHDRIDKLQIVAEKEWHGRIISCFPENDMEWQNKFAGFSKPGANRQLSVWNGLKDIRSYAEDRDNVVIHDSARPLVSNAMISECLDMLKEHEGVMPALPMKDTVYLGKEGRIVSLLDRSRVIAGQAPEAFAFGKYYQANQELMPDQILKINGSAEPAMMAGMDVVYIAGEETNFKITTKADLERFEQLLKQRKQVKEQHGGER